jgi:hypothetical protein
MQFLLTLLLTLILKIKSAILDYRDKPLPKTVFVPVPILEK